MHKPLCETVLGHIDKIDNNNASGEYYLTDIIGLINKNSNNIPVCGALITNNEDVLGINTQEELKTAENILLARKK